MSEDKTVAEREKNERTARTAKGGTGRKKQNTGTPRPEKARRAEPAPASAGAARPKARRKKRSVWNTISVFLIVLAVLIAAACGAAVYLGHRITNGDTNLPNVYVEGVNVGGLTVQQTLEKLNEQGWDERAATPLTVELPAGVSFTLDRREAGAAMTAEAAAKSAFRYGHGSSWLDNLIRYAECTRNRVDVSLGYLKQDQDYIRSKAEAGIRQFEKATAAESDEPYILDKEKAELRLVKGAGELKIDLDGLCREISRALAKDETELAHTHIDNTLDMPDFDKFFEELNVEPADAYFDGDAFDVVDEVVGCTFDVDKAKTAWENADPMDEVVVPLVITEPKVTGEALRGMLFRDKLGEQTTYFASSSENRINNISLAASKLDGIVLLPGETLSYNQTIGQRTKDAGFLEAGAYMDGEVVQEIGGGICQVSSTLYCAVMYANLQTVARTSHYFRVDYLPIAYDATVSWPKPDFQFANNRQFPVKIQTSVDKSGKSLTIQIWGTDVDGSHVELRNQSYVIYDDTYTDVVVGWGAQAWRDVYDKDGNKIDTIKEPYSIYNKHPEDIEWPKEKLQADREQGGTDDSGGYDEPASIWEDDGQDQGWGGGSAEIIFG